MLYVLKIGQDVCGPLTGHQVVAYFDAGHINETTPVILFGEDPQSLDDGNCSTLEDMELFEELPELRATADNPSVYYLSRILRSQEEQVRLLGALRWAVVSIGISLAIVFFVLGRH